MITFISTPSCASSPPCTHISISSQLLASFYVLCNICVQRCITTPELHTEVIMDTEAQAQSNRGGRASSYTYRSVIAITDDLVPLRNGPVTGGSDEETVWHKIICGPRFGCGTMPIRFRTVIVNQTSALMHFVCGCNRKQSNISWRTTPY